MKPLSVAVLVVLALAGGFAAGRWSLPAAPTPGPAMPASAPMAAPLAAAPGMGGGFLPKHEPTETQVVQGTVREVIQVPTYTYVRLETPQGETWAAVESNPGLKAGSSMVIEGATLMENFASKTLNRTFAQIYFGREQGAIPVGGRTVQ